MKLHTKEYPTQETGDELSFLEIKNTKSKFDYKNESKNGNFSNSFINIIDNFNHLDQSMIKKEKMSQKSSFLTSIDPCKEYKYAIVGKRIVKLYLNQSIEDTLNIINKCRKISIDTYTTPCKDKKNKCYKLNSNHSKYNCSDEFHSTRLSCREKTPVNDLSKLKLTNSQIINLNEPIIQSQKGCLIKPGEIKSKNSKFKAPSKDLNRIKVKIEYNKYNKTISRVTKK
jgi:hypothetical protein